MSYLHFPPKMKIMREVMLILHFLGLAMGIGTSFAHAFLSVPASKMEKDDAVRFRMNVMVLSLMGHIGLGLLLISGIYLIIPYWPSLPEHPLLIAKLVLVLMLIILLSLISRGVKRAKQGNAEEHLKKIEPLGKLTLFISLAIVILAVFVFH